MSRRRYLHHGNSKQKSEDVKYYLEGNCADIQMKRWRGSRTNFDSHWDNSANVTAYTRRPQNSLVSTRTSPTPSQNPPPNTFWTKLTGDSLQFSRRMTESEVNGTTTSSRWTRTTSTTTAPRTSATTLEKYRNRRGPVMDPSAAPRPRHQLNYGINAADVIPGRNSSRISTEDSSNGCTIKLH